MRKFVLLLVLVFAALGCWATWVALQFVFTSPGESSQTQYFDVAQGASLNSISENLFREGLIQDPFLFKLLAKGMRSSDKLRVGEYELNRGMTPVQILEKLISGQSVQYTLTFPEGINLYEIAQLVEEKKVGNREEFLRLCRDSGFIQELLGESQESLEGYLFPETYKVTKFTGEKRLIAMMVENFKRTYSEIKNAGEKKLPRHEHVTLASIIEKETGAPWERPLISSVFHNRLKKSMRLQSDPTIIYGILDTNGGEPVRNITKQDILTKTRYNTYKIQALPPGPIANPGKDSLLATLSPKESDYLYFVSRNDGTHVFSKTYEEHLKAVRTYQLDNRMREGKSWRDLDKVDR